MIMGNVNGNISPLWSFIEVLYYPSVVVVSFRNKLCMASHATAAVPRRPGRMKARGKGGCQKSQESRKQKELCATKEKPSAAMLTPPEL